MTATTSTGSRSLLRAVEDRLPALEASASDCNRDGRMSAASMEALQGSGLTSVFRAAAFGGRAVDLEDYLLALREMAVVAPSAAWCLQIYNVTNWLIGALFADDVLAQVYGPDTVVTGSMVPAVSCVATPVDGGYRVTGAWRFVSGCDHAGWIFLKAPVAGTEPTSHVLVLVPQGACTIAEDWEFSGLEGTGSKGVSLTDLRVPSAFAVPFDDHVLESGDGVSLGRELPHFALPSRVIMRLPISAVAIGVARHALRLFEANMSQERPNGFSPRDLPSFRARFAESELDVDLADRIVFDVAREAGALVASGEAFTPLVRARQGRDLVHAVHLCARSVDRLVEVSGARQMYAHSPMQQAFRDVRAIACHHSCDRDRMISAYARERLGLDANGEVL